MTSVNDVPTGLATAILTDDTEDTVYNINTSDLLKGFFDPDGNDTLSIINLTATNGVLTPISTGWQFKPNINYNGIVNLNYSVTDGTTATLPATQHFNVIAINDSPTGNATAQLINGTENVPYTINANNLLAGFSDLDGDSLSVANLATNKGTIIDNGNGTFTLNPMLNAYGIVSLSYNVIDGHGGSIPATQSINLVYSNLPPSGSATALLVNGKEDAIYSIKASDLVLGFSDTNGDTLSATNLTSTSGSFTPNATGWTFIPNPNYNGIVTLNYNITDGIDNISATQHFNLTPVNDPPQGNVSIVGTVQQGQVLTATNTLSDVDGLGSISYEWQANSLTIATGNTYTLTDAEVGKAITVTASYTDLGGTTENIIRVAINCE